MFNASYVIDESKSEVKFEMCFHFPEEEVKERAKRAAAAARRWREYSRRGADKPPSYKLLEARSHHAN